VTLFLRRRGGARSRPRFDHEDRAYRSDGRVVKPAFRPADASSSFPCALAVASPTPRVRTPRAWSSFEMTGASSRSPAVSSGGRRSYPTATGRLGASSPRRSSRSPAGRCAPPSTPMLRARWRFPECCRARVDGSCFTAALVADGARRVAVIVEPAHPARISPLLMAAYQLTERERDVTRLVLRGDSTSLIAEALFVSPHTVQQHPKSVFEKSGVRSRRELVCLVRPSLS